MLGLNVTQRTEDLLITQEEQNRETRGRKKIEGRGRKRRYSELLVNERIFLPIFL